MTSLTTYINSLDKGDVFTTKNRQRKYLADFHVIEVNDINIIAKRLNHFDNSLFNEIFFFNKKNGKETTGRFVIQLNSIKK